MTDKIVQNQVSVIGNTLCQKVLTFKKIGTSAGGPNWVEYLTGCFSGLPSKCKTQLWDFAFAGSDVATELLVSQLPWFMILCLPLIYSTPLHHNYTVSFEEQIIQWATYAKPVLPVKLSKALVAIWIGINDINDSAKYTFPRNNATDFPSFYGKIMEAEFKSIETIYEAGYRNFLFMNLPPLERTVCLQRSSSLPLSSDLIYDSPAIKSVPTHFQIGLWCINTIAPSPPQQQSLLHLILVPKQ